MKEPEFRKAGSAAQGPEVPDFYHILGLVESYAVDLAELESNYLARAKEVHPDRFASAPAAQRVLALQKSMQLNDAYKTLKRPMSRAEYLLARHGVTIGDNEALDPAFLMEVLELREELAEAKRARDVAALRRLEDDMDRRLQATHDEIAALFARLEAQKDPGLLAAVKDKVILLRYIRRYMDEFDGEFDDEFDELDDDASEREGNTSKGGHHEPYADLRAR